MISAGDVFGKRIVCLGTSPAMLFEGLRLSQAGAKVTFIDRAEEIGGGWRTRELFGVKGMEVGAHLFENRRAVNTILSSVLRDDELVVDEEGFGLVRGRRVSLRLARALLYSGLVTKALVRGDKDAAQHAVGNFFAAASNWQVPLIYPKGGIQLLLERLRTLLDAAGAVFRWGIEVKRVICGPDHVILEGDSFSYSADRLVMSSRSHAPISGLEAEWSGMRTTLVNTLVMPLEPNQLRFNGYVELFSNKVIKRIRRPDVNGLGFERPFVIVQMRRMAETVGDTARDFIEEAFRLGLLNTCRAPIAIHHEVVKYQTLSARSLSCMALWSGGRIDAIATVDFSDPRPFTVSD